MLLRKTNGVCCCLRPLARESGEGRLPEPTGESIPKVSTLTNSRLGKYAGPVTAVLPRPLENIAVVGEEGEE
jgi:hypothetical protein